jgi:hypothetical protein
MIDIVVPMVMSLVDIGGHLDGLRDSELSQQSSVRWAAFGVASETGFEGRRELILKVYDLILCFLPIEFIHLNLSFKCRNVIFFHFKSMDEAQGDGSL